MSEKLFMLRFAFLLHLGLENMKLNNKVMGNTTQRFDGNIGQIRTFNFPSDGEKSEFEFATKADYYAYVRGLKEQRKEVRHITRNNYAKQQAKRKKRVARVTYVNGKRILQLVN